MPQMGESLSEGTVTKWLKRPGQRVELDEPLFEITTDKVDTEVPAPAAGILQEILVAEGQTVAVGTPVALIGAEAPEGKAKVADAAAPAPIAPAPAAASAGGGGHFRSSHEPKTFQRRSGGTAPAATTPPRPTAGSPRLGHLSPAVRSLAAERGIAMEELLDVPGSGRGGRINRRDVERYLDEGRSRSREVARGPIAAAPQGPPPGYLYRPEAEDRLVPMSNMRKQIAEHMIWSQQISAQVTSFSECDMHRVVRYRDEHRERFEATEGVPLSFLPFVAEAAVKALKAFPIFNSSVVGDQIALKKHVHLGIAVALEEGLIVPVVRNADGMNFVGLARGIHRLAEKARGRGLEPADVRGATFTITNPGMFGGLTGTPMIAQPQVAILGLGAVTKKPVVVDDAIAIRPIMVLALTFDHRIIDGATGFQFLERIRVDLENFDLPAA
jgi:2-oxoglutarate dehydrogenase E2 component (dihydrolipoamide succinyltransferase)